jgi:hypothetical protein
MRETLITMGMPVSLAVPNVQIHLRGTDAVFAEFAAGDAQFSPFKIAKFPVSIALKAAAQTRRSKVTFSESKGLF